MVPRPESELADPMTDLCGKSAGIPSSSPWGLATFLDQYPKSNLGAMPVADLGRCCRRDG